MISLLIAVAALGQAAEASPIMVEPVKLHFFTFTHADHPNNCIGYRFWEHEPLIGGRAPVPTDRTDQALLKEMWAEAEQRPGAVTRPYRVSKEGWDPQKWTMLMVPVADGIEMYLEVEVEDASLPPYYGIQQCFRLSGATNEAWRQAIARTPAFSEYDLWATTPANQSKRSLSYVIRDGDWHALPAQEACVGARTPYGAQVDETRFPGGLPDTIGPYKGGVQPPVDNGLIARQSVDDRWVCGVYWEGTSHVTVHHPADCLHAIVNIGPLRSGGRHIVRGKAYWFEGTLDDLAAHHAADFGISESR